MLSLIDQCIAQKKKKKKKKKKQKKKKLQKKKKSVTVQGGQWGHASNRIRNGTRQLLAIDKYALKQKINIRSVSISDYKEQ